MPALGDTFEWRGNGFKEHLYIVLNRPEKCGGKTVVINITESVGGKASMVLVKGQHSYIYKPSDVNFGDAFVADASYIEGEIKSFSAFSKEKMDLALVEKIARVAIVHPAVSREVQIRLKEAWP